MENKVIFHIGIPKTGTTAIQYMLHENALVLRDYGYYYPDFHTECGVQYDIGEIVQKNGNAFLKDRELISINCDRWRELCNYIKELIKDYNVIISAEEFSKSKIMKDLLVEAKKEFNNIGVVVYLRRQDIQIEQLWKQYVKGIGIQESIEDFFENLRNSFIYNYYKYINSIENIVGIGNCKVRCYERSQLPDGNVEKDFCEYLNIPYEKMDQTYNKYGMLNPSIEGGYAEIMRCFNSIGWKSESHRWEYIDMLLDVQKTDNNKDYGSFISPELRADILKQYEEENKKVAQKYLGRQDGILFYDNPEEENYKPVTFTENEILLVKCTFAMIQHMEREIVHINICRQSTMEYLYIRACGDRKMTIFGAGNKCDLFFNRYQKLPVECILDNDKSKNGKCINGYVIRHPDDIENWEERYIIIVTVYHDQIKTQLEGLGLKEFDDYMIPLDVY